MRAIIRLGGSLSALLFAASISFGYTWVTPVYRVPIPPAPDACGPGFYAVNNYGGVYGPNYYLRPPWAPFNGHLPVPRCGPNGLPCAGGSPPQEYPSHPFVRGPRDFFMFNEVLEEQMNRDRRPSYVP